MAFPFLFEENFSLGTLGGFNSETDTDSKLSFPHFASLAQRAPLLDVPFRDAYAAHIDLSGGTNDALLTELEGFDVAANTAAAVRFYLFVSTNLTMATTDTFDILRWQSAGPVNEFSINILDTAGAKTIRAGDTGGATFRSSPLTLGVWHSVELVINTGTGANGTADFYLDGYQIGAQVGSIASAALTQAQMGTMGIDAGTTAGHLLFSNIIVDDARVYPVQSRFSPEVTITKSGHYALGPGRLDHLTLVSGGTDNVIKIYDTDEAILADAGNLVAMISAGVANDSMEIMHPVHFNRGCYVNLAGTNPLVRAVFGQANLSRALVRNYALMRKPSAV